MFEKPKRANVALFLCFLISVPLAGPVWADSDALALTAAAADLEGDAAPSVSSESEGGSSGSAQSSAGSPDAGPGKLQVHGFLTQAWATADFTEPPVDTLPDGSVGPVGPSPSTSEISLGIPEDGTTNYRFLALQFRYDISETDTVVVQLSSRTLGFSPIQDQEDEIELDWAFYERKIGDQTSLKVGRVQIPYGIYNEYRDVGTILPFYRPAFVLYKEGSFTSETVDGLSISHTFFADSDWTLEASAYGGEWEAVQLNLDDPNISGTVRAKDGYGYQFWLNTPVTGLRIGTSLLSLKQEGGPLSVVGRRDLYLGSLDLSLARFTFQGEFQTEEVTFASFPGAPNQVITTAEWYALAGFRITDKTGIWAQFESAKFDFEWPGAITNSFTALSREDLGVAFHYYFAPNLLLKLEQHWTKEGYLQFYPTSPVGFPLRPGLFEGDGGGYSIVSFSVSF